MHARGRHVDRAVAHDAAAIDNENRRAGYPAFLFRVVNIPLLHDEAFPVRQNWKWEAQFAAHGFGFFRRVDRDSGDVCTRSANFIVMVAIVRQLAEAERSPMPAKEDED